MAGTPLQQQLRCNRCGRWKNKREITLEIPSDTDDTTETLVQEFQICQTPGCSQRERDRWGVREWQLEHDPALDDSPEIREQERQQIVEDEQELVENLNDFGGGRSEPRDITERSESNREDLPGYSDIKEEIQFADPELAATQVPQLVAILEGEDNEQAAEFRHEAEKHDRPPQEYVQTMAAQQLCDFASHHPAVVATHAGTLVEHLDTENKSIRRRITLAVVDAVTEPELFVEYAPTFITLLHHDDPAVRGTAAFVLGGIATVSPDDAVPAVGALIPLVGDSKARADATSALARIGDERPEAITAAAQPVCHHFQALSPATANPEPGDIRFRVSALEVIAHIAFAAPDTIDDVSEALIRAIQSQNGDVRFQAADTMSILLTECTDTFASLASYVPSCLNDEESDVRRAAALGCIRIGLYLPELVDDPAAIAERLRVLATEFDDLPADHLEQALQNFDAATDGSH